jgi:hypothetical protein
MSPSDGLFPSLKEFFKGIIWEITDKHYGGGWANKDTAAGTWRQVHT